jgi:hypothetical protein
MVIMMMVMMMMMIKIIMMVMMMMTIIMPLACVYLKREADEQSRSKLFLPMGPVRGALDQGLDLQAESNSSDVAE